MRNISPDTFTDEVVARDASTLIIWIGLITAIADDQGRMIDNPALIRASLLPYDEKTSTSSIEKILKYFSDKHKITRYVAGMNGSGRKLIQINSWWKYQRSAQWAASSNYPAPEKWIDRIRMHVPGGQILTVNWDSDGGYIATTKALRSLDTTKPLQSAKKAPKVSLEVKDEVKGNVKGKVKVDKTTPPTPHGSTQKTNGQAGKDGKEKRSSFNGSVMFSDLKTKEQRQRAETAMKILRSSGLRNPKLKDTSVIVATRKFENQKHFVSYLLAALASAYADPNANDKAIVASHRIESDTVPPQFKKSDLWSSLPVEILQAAKVGEQVIDKSGKWDMDKWDL